MDKKQQLREIVKNCEKHFNRGISDHWKHGDFNDFSREILKATKVNISSNTLKRIFGKISVDDYYLPQQATIDALKKYCNYLPTDIVHNTEAIQPEFSNNSSPAIWIKYRYLWGIFIVVLIVLSLFFLTKTKDDLGVVKLSKTEGLLPKTAFFDIKLPDTKDSIFADFGDKSPLIYLDPEQKKISHIYLFPGVFKVNLKHFDNIIAKTKVYVPSNKWLGLGYHLQRDLPNSFYAFPAIKNGNDSLFHIPNVQLHKAGLDTINSYYTRLCNFTPINHLSDEFVFETIFKNELQKKGIYCNSMQFQISGQDNMIRFNFVSSGCSSRVLNFISEQTFKGTKTDLSQFVIDLDQWNTIKLINRNKNLSLFVNGKLLFRGSYKHSLGNLRGVFVEFKNNGYVKKCNLKSLEGKVLYHF